MQLDSALLTRTEGHFFMGDWNTENHGGYLEGGCPNPLSLRAACKRCPLLHRAHSQSRPFHTPPPLPPPPSPVSRDYSQLLRALCTQVLGAGHVKLSPSPAPHQFKAPECHQLPSGWPRGSGVCERQGRPADVVQNKPTSTERR